MDDILSNVRKWLEEIKATKNTISENEARFIKQNLKSKLKNWIQDLDTRKINEIKQEYWITTNKRDEYTLEEIDSEYYKNKVTTEFPEINRLWQNRLENLEKFLENPKILVDNPNIWKRITEEEIIKRIIRNKDYIEKYKVLKNIEDLVLEEQNKYIKKYWSEKSYILEKYPDGLIEYYDDMLKYEPKEILLDNIQNNKIWINKEIKYNKKDEDIIDDIYRAWKGNNGSIKGRWSRKYYYNQDFYNLKDKYIKSAIEKILKRNPENISVLKWLDSYWKPVMYFNIYWRQVSFHTQYSIGINDLIKDFSNVEWIWKSTKVNPLKYSDEDFIKYYWKFIK
jgi:hypothetical protein